MVAGMVLPARADLIGNGGFETGDFTGWTLVETVSGSDYVSDLPIAPHGGDFAAELGKVAAPDASLSQSFATTAGDVYRVTFWHVYTTAAVPPNDFAAKLDGNPLLSAPDTLGPTDWTEYSFDVVATGSLGTLEFDFRQDTDYQGLDDVSVSQLPEPATLSLFGAGLLLLGWYRRRKAA